MKKGRIELKEKTGEDERIAPPQTTQKSGRRKVKFLRLLAPLDDAQNAIYLDQQFQNQLVAGTVTKIELDESTALACVTIRGGGSDVELWVKEWLYAQGFGE